MFQLIFVLRCTTYSRLTENKWSFVRTLKGKITRGQDSLNYKKKQNLIKYKIVLYSTKFYQCSWINVKVMTEPQKTSLERYYLLSRVLCTCVGFCKKYVLYKKKKKKRKRKKKTGLCIETKILNWREKVTSLPQQQPTGKKVECKNLPLNFWKGSLYQQEHFSVFLLVDFFRDSYETKTQWQCEKFSKEMMY